MRILLIHNRLGGRLIVLFLMALAHIPVQQKVMEA